MKTADKPAAVAILRPFGFTPFGGAHDVPSLWQRLAKRAIADTTAGRL
jgi:hypothetical protein